MAKLKKEQVVKAVESMIADAEGYETDELAAMREEALNYYYTRDKAAPHATGRSSLQSSDVADMIEAVVSQMLPAFEGDHVAVFPPAGEQDVEQARAETDAVTYVIMQQNNGHYEIQQAVRDALLLRNGVMKVYPDERIEIETVYLDRVTEEQLAGIQLQAHTDLAKTDNGYLVVEYSEDEEYLGTYNVTLKAKQTERKVCTRAVDIAHFSWERDWDSIFLEECRFVAERSLPTRSELIQMGYKRSIVNSLNYGGNDTQVDSLARNQHSNRRHWQGETKAEDIIEFWECYVRLDVDGDGVAELLKVCIASSTLLEMEPVEYIPYAVGTPFLQPHRFNGLGLYDKLKNVQDAKTATLRQMMDNQNHANNARVQVMDGMVNLDDVTNSRPGGVVRTTGPGAVTPFPFTDIGPSAQNTLGYLDKIRSERGGASLDMQSAELQIAGETAHGVERQMSAKEQLAAMITRTMAETLLRQLYILTHKALRLYLPDDISFQVMDNFVTTNPAEWQERKQVQVKAGLSMAERMRKSSALEAIIMRQDALKQQGVYVSQDDVYNAQLDWARANSIQNPERYFTDPQSEEAMQAAQQQQEQQQQAEQMQYAMIELQKLFEERKADNADAKVAEDARQFDMQLRFDIWKQRMEQAGIDVSNIIQFVGGMIGNDKGASEDSVRGQLGTGPD